MHVFDSISFTSFQSDHSHFCVGYLVTQRVKDCWNLFFRPVGEHIYQHLIELRLYLEPDVARTAARFRTSDDVDALTDLLDRADMSLKESRKEARLINVGFHFEVAKITRNALIIFLCESKGKMLDQARIRW